jgi:hypothetical protein
VVIGDDLQNRIHWFKSNQGLNLSFSIFIIMDLKKSIKKILKEEFDWIESEINPWSNIPEDDMNQLTSDERDIIVNIMETETYWNEREGCKPKYEITDLEFDEYDDWYGGVNHGLKRMIKLCFTTTCENQNYNNKTYLCATINRNTLDYHVA